MEQSLDEIIAGKHKEEGSSKPRRDRKRGGRGSERRRGPRRAADDRRREPPCVLIKNLHRDINESELRDLFREVGPISRVSIDYDSSDKRTGRAWVLYNYGEDAAVAAGRFNGRRAVGQIITVKQVRNIGDLDHSSAPLSERIGGSGRGSNSADSKRKRRGGSGSSRAERARPKTQEELDAELDAYMNDAPPSTSTSEAPAPVAVPVAAAAEPAPAPEPVEDAMIE